MITCQTCQTACYAGTLFCPECGARLYMQPSLTPRFRGERATEELALLLQDRRVTLPLTGQDEFSLGRADERQAIVPDIDLKPYGAYELGVSRIHASIRREDIRREKDRITVTDMGSANGTYLNGQRLEPQTPYSLHNGDRLRLGKLEALIHIPTGTHGATNGNYSPVTRSE